jgi:peptidoglycan LD-endopeptidase LytH
MEPALFELLFMNRSKFGDVVPKSFLRKPHLEINFPDVFLGYLKLHPELKLGPEDITSPEKCARIVKKIQRKLGVEWSYGGWLENRSVILRDSYLKTTQSWIHLGIDINLPVGTPIHAAMHGTVYIVDSDYPEEGGWGTFVILEHTLNSTIFYSISGHLSKKRAVTKGQKVSRGDVIGRVGNTKENGFWFPHVHFQFISEQEMRAREHPFTLDGYGKQKDLSYLRQHYPDPLVCLPMADLQKKKAT